MNRIKKHNKIRQSISGTAERPRLAVYRSLNHLHAQVIDDTKSITLASATSLKEKGSLMVKAVFIGKTIADKSKELGIKELVFDRSGFRYHGAIKEVCEQVRKEGIKI